VAAYPLFDAYPLLRETIPRLALGSWPTPLEPLNHLSSRPGGPPLLIKRDDLSHPLYGGNKVRKFELSLAEARRRGCREVITAGGLGSHHVLAAAALGAAAGLRTTGLFFCQPVNDYVRQNLILEAAFGTEMHFVRDYGGLARGYLRLYLSRRFASGRRPYLIMPGGSTPLTTLAYLNAVLELRAQLAERGLPDPDAVFTAAGSGGTAAGLLAGIALAGMETTLFAVRVVHPSILGRKRILALARKALRLLKRRGVDTAAAEGRLAGRLRLAEDYLGEGYGFATAAGEEAMRRFREASGIELEGCYTAKAAAAFLDYSDGFARAVPERPAVFIHTASSTHREASKIIPPAASLPAAFHWCFDGGSCGRRCGLYQRNRPFCEGAGGEINNAMRC
jgi:D-cysteine desulfhydrase